MYGIDDDKVILGKDSIIRRRFRMSKNSNNYLLTFEWRDEVTQTWKEATYPFSDSTTDLYETQERFNIRRCVFFRILQRVKCAPGHTFLIYSGNEFS